MGDLFGRSKGGTNKIENFLQGAHIVSNGEININRYLWEETVELFTQDEIISYLDRIIDKYGIPFPFKKISKSEARRDFKALELFDVNYLTSINKWNCQRTNMKPLLYKKSSIFVKQSNVGLTSSDYFHHIERAKVGHERYKSPYEAWHSKGKRYFLKALFVQKRVNSSTLRQSLQIKQFWASQFRPSSAKWIYEMFGAEDILDFSMGWGDRLAAFHSSSSTKSYIGVDPNSILHKKYKAQDKLYNTGKKTKFICLPSEEVDYSKISVDFVFTSPPYFNQERYSTEPTQSWIRYGNYLNDWLKKFLFPTLEGCWSCLREGGRILINISDFYNRKGHLQVCRPMLEFMEKLGANYEGVIGYRMTKRVASSNWHGNDNVVYCEPIWIWVKGNAPDPKLKDCCNILFNNVPEEYEMV